jgi:hypothetical protein
VLSPRRACDSNLGPGLDLGRCSGTIPRLVTFVWHCYNSSLTSRPAVLRPSEARDRVVTIAIAET